MIRSGRECNRGVTYLTHRLGQFQRRVAICVLVWIGPGLKVLCLRQVESMITKLGY